MPQELFQIRPSVFYNELAGELLVVPADKTASYFFNLATQSILDFFSQPKSKEELLSYLALSSSAVSEIQYLSRFLEDLLGKKILAPVHAGRKYRKNLSTPSILYIRPSFRRESKFCLNLLRLHFWKEAS
jgi:hypothetical protein